MQNAFGILHFAFLEVTVGNCSDLQSRGTARHHEPGSVGAAQARPRHRGDERVEHDRRGRGQTVRGPSRPPAQHRFTRRRHLRRNPGGQRQEGRPAAQEGGRAAQARGPRVAAAATRENGEAGGARARTGARAGSRTDAATARGHAAAIAGRRNPAGRGGASSQDRSNRDTVRAVRRARRSTGSDDRGSARPPTSRPPGAAPPRPAYPGTTPRPTPGGPRPLPSQPVRTQQPGLPPRPGGPYPQRPGMPSRPPMRPAYQGHRPAAGARRESTPRPAAPPMPVAPPPVTRTITLAEGMTVKDLADKLDLRVKDVLAKLLMKRLMMTINSALDTETATMIAREFGADVQLRSFEEELQVDTEVSRPEDVITRAPVVTV